MTKEEFNNLELLDQIELINKMLVNQSLSSIGKDIGISEATLRTRFKKGGYLRVNNQFINETSNTTITTINTKPKVDTKPKEPIKNKIDINTLHEKIKALEGRISKLENTTITTNTDTVNATNTDTIDVIEFDGDTVSRAYRIDKEVQEQFKLFCRRHSEHKVQDIISSALLEYMKKNI